MVWIKKAVGLIWVKTGQRPVYEDPEVFKAP